MGPTNFPLHTSDQSSRQNADFFTQCRDISLDDPNSPLYQFNNSLPRVLPQELEYVSSVYPVLPVQEQLGETVKTSPQLGPEIQTFELHTNGSGPDQVRERSEKKPADPLILRQLAYHGSEQLLGTHQ